MSVLLLCIQKIEIFVKKIKIKKVTNNVYNENVFEGGDPMGLCSYVMVETHHLPRTV